MSHILQVFYSTEFASVIVWNNWTNSLQSCSEPHSFTKSVSVSLQRELSFRM